MRIVIFHLHRMSGIFRGKLNFMQVGDVSACMEE